VLVIPIAGTAARWRRLAIDPGYQPQVTAFAKKILIFLGFDRAVSFGIMARMWTLIAGPITMLVIAAGFSADQQGFYYTFGSLLALQIFFDLGLMFVISQFTSHEFVHLSWQPRGRVDGDPKALQRFTDLLCKTVLWFGVASLVLAAVLIPAGLIFFGQKGDTDFSWRIPWVLAVCGTALNLFVMPFFAVIMGSGDVVTVNKRELAGTVLSSILTWLVIGLHGGLYAAFAVNFGMLAISWGYLLGRRLELVKLALAGIFVRGRLRVGASGLSWWGEIWPMQWRMAVSAGASYFIFQLFNPVLFHYQGAVVAGQMGMTLTAGNALLAGSMTVLSARTPEFGKLIAVQNWESLDSLFFKVTKQSLALVLAGAFVGVAAIWVLQSNFAIGRRFIPVEQAAFLFGAVCFQSISGSLATYLRAHKREPLMKMTIFASILQGMATLFLGKYYSSFGVTAGYFAVTAFFVFTFVLYVWIKCRREWHMAVTPGEVAGSIGEIR
jgi:O-antigen/teichoic acid export membrane protein